MGVEQAPTKDGKESAKGFRKETIIEEREVEVETGKPLEKGAERFEERSKSSDGKSAGEKQR